MIAYKKIIDNISIGVSLVSPKKKLLYANKQMKKWFSRGGLSQELICHNIFSNFYKESGIICPTCKALSSKEIQDALVKVSLEGVNAVYKIISFPVKNEKGQIVAVIETIEDFTRFDNQEKEIRHNYLVQAAINSILRFSLENISLEEFLKCTLNVILSVPLFSSLGMGVIFLVEDESQILTMKAHVRLPEDLQKEYRRVPFKKNVCGQAAFLGDFKFDDGLAKDSEFERKNFKSYARYCSPIVYAGNVVGVIEVCLEKGHKKGKKEEDFLNIIATTLAGVIQRKRDEERLSRINECLLNLGVNPLENIQRLVVLCGRILRTTSAFYNRFNLKEDNYSSLACYNPPVGYIGENKYSQSICYDVINKKEEGPLVVSDLLHSAYIGKDFFCSLYQFNTYIGQTVKCRGKPKGVLCGVYKDEHLLGSEDKKFLGIIALAIGIEEERIKTNEELGLSLKELKLAQHGLVQSEKLAALGRFSSGIAHEVKNPLGIILGGTEYLEKKLQSTDKDVMIALEKIKESTLRADAVVRNLVKFAMPAKMKKEKVCSRDLVNDALSLLKYRSSSVGVEIIVEFPKKDICIEADKNQLHQVLFNILINAINAMPGKGVVKVKVYKDSGLKFSKAKPVCVIEIIDKGKGIPEENLCRVFEPFFTTERDKKGTGLGLAISKTIVENHQGFLLIDSRLGKGTRVRIVLPAFS